MGRDKISSLPDDVLLRIISLLDTQCAICTGVLSRRWQFLWMKSPCIRLHEMHCKPISMPKDISCSDEAMLMRERFIAAVDAVLQSHTAPILEVFSVSFNSVLSSEGEEEKYLSRWVHHVTTTRKVKDLSIKFPLVYITYPPRPPSFFHLPPCESVTSLQVSGISIETSTSCEGFTSIKRLFLAGCYLSNVLIKSFFTSCPSLRSCTVTGCFLQSDLSFCAPWLEVLVMEIFGVCTVLSGFGQEEVFIGEPAVEIDAPSLEYLRLRCINCLKYVSLDNMQSLTTLELVTLPRNSSYYDYLEPHNLAELGRVKKLLIESYLLMDFHEWREQNEDTHVVCQMDSLEHFILEGFNIFEELHALACLLDMAPEIRKLTLMDPRTNNSRNRRSFDDLSCESLKNLKEIHVFGVLELELVKFLLKWASGLQLLEIEMGTNLLSELSCETELLEVTRDGVPKICFCSRFESSVGKSLGYSK